MRRRGLARLGSSLAALLVLSGCAGPGLSGGPAVEPVDQETAEQLLGEVLPDRTELPEGMAGAVERSLSLASFGVDFPEDGGPEIDADRVARAYRTHMSVGWNNPAPDRPRFAVNVDVIQFASEEAAENAISVYAETTDPEHRIVFELGGVGVYTATEEYRHEAYPEHTEQRDVAVDFTDIDGSEARLVGGSAVTRQGAYVLFVTTTAVEDADGVNAAAAEGFLDEYLRGILERFLALPPVAE